MTFKALNDVLNVRDDPTLLSLNLPVSVFPEGSNQKGLFKSYYQDDDLSSLDQSDISSSLESSHQGIKPDQVTDPIVLITVDSTVVSSFAASTNGSERSKQGKPEIDEMGQINEMGQTDGQT